MLFDFNFYRKFRAAEYYQTEKKQAQHAATNPVVLVPGYRDNSTVFRKLTQYLKEEAFNVHPLTLRPSDGRLPLNQLAEQVAGYVEQTFSTGQAINFIGFSMGGIVLRFYLQRLGGLVRAERLITLGSPHRGTWMAYYSGRPGVRQMRPNSPFLLDLAQDEEILDRIHFTSIWTPLDLTIVPSSSSVTKAGRHVRLLIPYHRGLVTHERALRLVSNALLEPLNRPILD